MKYYIICSDKYPERKKSALEQMKRIGVNDYEIVESVFIDKLPDDFLKRPYIGIDLRKGIGVVGCYLAHRKAIEKGLNHNDHIMIIEDDVEFDAPFYLKMRNHILDTINHKNVMVLKLNNSNRHSFSEPDSFEFIRNSKVPTNNEAYIIHRKAKEWIYNSFGKYYGGPDLVLHKICMDKKLKCYNIKPALVRQKLFHSIIEEKNRLNINTEGNRFLFLEYYRHSVETRKIEIIDSIKNNIRLGIFGKVYIFGKPNECGDLKIKTENVKIVQTEKRVMFQDIIDYSNGIVKDNDISVLINNDIELSGSFRNILPLEKEFYCISRWEKGQGVPYRYKQADSQDVWCWRGKNKIRNANFYMGVNGCDNRLAYLATVAGYVPRNPAFTFISFHNHKSGIRDNNRNRIPEPYKRVHAEMI